MRTKVSQGLGCLAETRALNRLLERLRTFPAPNVHEPKVGAWRDGLVKRRVDVTRLGLQVAARCLPPANELILPAFRHLKRIDQHKALRSTLHENLLCTRSLAVLPR